MMRAAFLSVWMVIGAAALIYMFGFVLDVLSLPVAIIVWTIVFVLVLRSPVDALERRGVRRGLGTTVAFAGMFAVLTALVVIMFSPMFGVNDQFANIFSALPVYVQGLIDWANSFTTGTPRFCRTTRCAVGLTRARSRSPIGRHLLRSSRPMAWCCLARASRMSSSFWVLLVVVAFWTAYGIARDRSRGRSVGAR